MNILETDMETERTEKAVLGITKKTTSVIWRRSSYLRVGCASPCVSGAVSHLNEEDRWDWA